MNLPDHGANPARLYKTSGIKQPVRMIDFSENVHPFGPPEFIRNEWAEMYMKITDYPDPDAEPFLSAASDFHKVSKDHVVASNGAAEIFTWLAKRYRKRQVVLIEPAFSEYRKTLEAEDALIIEVQANPESNWKVETQEVIGKLNLASALYVCNPHNPTGVLMNLQQLTELAQACLLEGCEMVIDEAFIDFVHERESFVPELLRFPNVIIIRSMTKMYAIPGLRLGYALASPHIISELKRGAAHWNVNGLSATIGARCFNEKAYRHRIIEQAESEKRKMRKFFLDHQCAVTDSAVNFLSFQLPNPEKSDEFFDEMLKAGMVLRHTKSFRGMDGNWFRIGIKSAHQMERLREEMERWLKDN